MDDQQLENRLTKLEESLDYIGEDIEEIKDTQNKIESLALSVNTLAVQVKRLVDDLCGIVGRVTILENKPAKRWESMISTLLSVIIGGMIGFIVRKFIG